MADDDDRVDDPGGVGVDSPPVVRQVHVDPQLLGPPVVGWFLSPKRQAASFFTHPISYHQYLRRRELGDCDLYKAANQSSLVMKRKEESCYVARLKSSLLYPLTFSRSCGLWSGGRKGLPESAVGVRALSLANCVPGTANVNSVVDAGVHQKGRGETLQGYGGIHAGFVGRSMVRRQGCYGHSVYTIRPLQ